MPLFPLIPAKAGTQAASAPHKLSLDSRLRGNERWMGVLAALIASPAAAHEGDHSHMVIAPALRHLFTEPNHLLILGMVVAVFALPVARLALRRIRR